MDLTTPSPEFAVPHPFEVDEAYLQAHLDEMVRLTVEDLVSEFLVMPKGTAFVEYADFRDAFEALKQVTRNFTNFNEVSVMQALRENSRVLNVLRAMLGMTPPEWADLAKTELASGVTQEAARRLDRDCRSNPSFVRDTERRYAERVARSRTANKMIPRPKSLSRIDDLVLDQTRS